MIWFLITGVCVAITFIAWCVVRVGAASDDDPVEHETTDTRPKWRDYE